MGNIAVKHRTSEKQTQNEEKSVLNSRNQNGRTTWGKMNTFQWNVEGIQKHWRAHDSFKKLLLFSRFVVLLQIVIAYLLLVKLIWNFFGNENVSTSTHGKHLVSFICKCSWNSVNFNRQKDDERKSFVKSPSAVA